MKLPLALSLCSVLAATSLAAAPSPPAAAAPSSSPVYRMDFELTTTEPGKPAVTTTFSLNLVEGRSGKAEIGDNVPLATGATESRQNVGIRVDAVFQTRGTDLVLEVNTELSALGSGGAMHRIVADDVALATPGKKTVIAALDHDRAKTQLSVVPTRL